MLIVPLQPVPNQTLTVLLANQNCRINVYQKFFGLYMDIAIGAAAPILTGGVCLDRNKMVRYSYLGFVGDLAFFDTQGTNDPTYDGLGSRYQLVYLEVADVAAIAAAAS
jgi:hypothetical protein